MSEGDATEQMRGLSRRAFLGAGVVVAATLAGFEGILHAREEDGLAWPLRRILQANERLARRFVGERQSAPLLPMSRVTHPARVNGDVGMDGDFDPASWTLMVQPPLQDGDDYDEFSLDEIKSLPRHEMTTEFHCIEGWSMVQTWAGARFADFVAQRTRFANHPLPPYVALVTPSGGYYVGLEIEAALHPQTLLCYEMNGAPLTLEHGAPLRLIIPVKYGVKNLKRIGLIRFSKTRPPDYWAEEGYDWYAGL